MYDLAIISSKSSSLYAVKEELVMFKTHIQPL